MKSADQRAIARCILIRMHMRSINSKYPSTICAKNDFISFDKTSVQTISKPQFSVDLLPFLPYLYFSLISHFLNF